MNDSSIWLWILNKDKFPYLVSFTIYSNLYHTYQSSIMLTGIVIKYKYHGSSSHLVSSINQLNPTILLLILFIQSYQSIQYDNHCQLEEPCSAIVCHPECPVLCLVPGSHVHSVRQRS
ncbi:hypothetical protein SAMD00019534_040830, partial [Acytostelium subglobosum LB1]|uniref:hypothetical protein n=1 Tax=Acytostelium subglobosum LB1 TaxID=1410327 RepID=UPI000644D1E8